MSKVYVNPEYVMETSHRQAIDGTPLWYHRPADGVDYARRKEQAEFFRNKARERERQQ